MIVHEYRSNGRGLKVAVSAFEGDEEETGSHLGAEDGACWLVIGRSDASRTTPIGREVVDVSLDDDGRERRTTTIEPHDLPLLDLDLRIVPVEPAEHDGLHFDHQTGEPISVPIARIPRLGERLTVVDAPEPGGKLVDPKTGATP